MPSSGATLVATDITRSHGAFVVLDGVSVTVGPRSRIGVVGPNGVGKTTLLRILAGLEPPDSGRLTLAPPTLTVGYLPQELEPRAGETLGAYLARRTGVAAAEAELEEAAALLEQPGAEDRYSHALERYLALGGPDLDARAAEVCEDLGLPADRLGVELGALSGGQGARAALAAILLSRFDVLLLDEPTNDLDFAGLAQLERFLGDLDGALVVVSHDRAFLEATIDRVLELDEHTRKSTEYGGGWLGYLEAKATARRHAEEAYDQYQTQRAGAGRPGPHPAPVGGAGRADGEEEPARPRQGPEGLPGQPHREAGGQGADHREGPRAPGGGGEAVGGLGPPPGAGAVVPQRRRGGPAGGRRGGARLVPPGADLAGGGVGRPAGHRRAERLGQDDAAAGPAGRATAERRASGGWAPAWWSASWTRAGAGSPPTSR